MLPSLLERVLQLGKVLVVALMLGHHLGTRPHRQGGPRVVITEVKVMTRMVIRGVPPDQTPRTELLTVSVDVAPRLVGPVPHVD